METRTAAIRLGLAAIACTAALTIKTLLRDFGLLTALGVLVVIVAVLIEAERKTRIGCRVHLTVVAAAAGAVAADPVIWLLR